MNPIKVLFSFLFLASLSTSYSQGLACFNDQVKHFWIFDRGNFSKAEYLEIESYEVGGPLVAYLTGSGNLKIYYQGETRMLLEGNPIRYTSTDYLLGYSVYEDLYVFDGGESYKLSSEAGAYVVEDSLIAWHNRIRRTIEVYYEGETTMLEDGLVNWPVNKFKTGDNLLAWITNFDQRFKVFYNGGVQVLDQFVEKLDFQAGRDIVAYFDEADQSFNVFFRGEVTELEPFPPTSYRVGNEIMAYIDNMGKFKYFSNGEVTQISSFAPDFYEVKDNVMIYGEQGFLKTFYNGEPVMLERYVPQIYKLSYNTIAYLNESSFIKAFQFGQSVDISYKPVKEIKLFRDIIVYSEGGNLIRIFYNGKVYEP